MSFLIAGWGLVYVGRIKWGFLFSAFMYVCSGLTIFLGLLNKLTLATSFAVIMFVLILASSIVTAVLARRYDGSPNTPRVKFHVFYVGLMLIIWGVLFLLNRYAYAFYIMSGHEMEPTILLGETIISESQAAPPKVGDIVVFRRASDILVYRVAALGGDTLAIVNGEVICNGENLGLFHAQAEHAKENYSQKLAPLKVELGYVYLLGDNRDRANDSRFSGQVKQQDIVGKITSIWFSKDKSRIGTEFQ
ncbi:signal peptidase I [Pseudomonas protegens]|uniref:signal peptidase I n=1 Tax=Pseudomonas protegens TaxID=380021 RepID=UPI0037F87732